MVISSSQAKRWPSDSLEGQHFAAGLMSTPLVPPSGHGFNGAVPLDMRASVAYSLLIRLRFDQAPVFDGRTPSGWVSTVHLQGRTDDSVAEALTPLSKCAFVAEDAPVQSVFRNLKEKRFVFTVSGNGLEGFIVPSDINRHVIRSSLFVVLAQTEIALGRILRKYSEISALEERYVNTKEHLRDAYQRDRERREDTHPVEYLQLREMIEVLDSVKDEIPDMPRDTQFWRDLRFLGEKRNSVMHPVRPLLTSALEDVIKVHERGRYLNDQLKVLT